MLNKVDYIFSFNKYLILNLIAINGKLIKKYFFRCIQLSGYFACKSSNENIRPHFAAYSGFWQL